MKLSRCPICESERIKVITGELTFQTHEGQTTIPNVKRQKCLSCGEEFFDHQANLVLDRYRCKKALAACS